MKVDDIIQIINQNIIIFDNSKNQLMDKDKVSLYGALKNILNNAMVYLAILYCKELKNFNCIEYKTKDNEIIPIPINREILERSLRRQILLDSWGQIEIFISKKTKGSEKITTSTLIKNYFSPNKAPFIITFFRETRNSIHGNGVYSHSKKQIEISIDGIDYSLLPGKEIKFADWNFLFNLINKSLGYL